MFTREEFGHILITIVVLMFVVNFSNVIEGDIDYKFIGISGLYIALILFVSITTKKLVADFYESTLEIRIWNLQRFGFSREAHLEKPIPAGVIFPFFISLLSLGNFLWFATLESRVEGTSARASKTHGRFRFTELTDIHLGLIVASGVVVTLFLAVIAYFINAPELARWSIYYAAYSLLPFGNLDGTKIFFGKKEIWFGLSIITLIFLAYALFLP